MWWVFLASLFGGRYGFCYGFPAALRKAMGTSCALVVAGRLALRACLWHAAGLHSPSAVAAVGVQRPAYPTSKVCNAPLIMLLSWCVWQPGGWALSPTLEGLRRAGCKGRERSRGADSESVRHQPRLVA